MAEPTFKVSDVLSRVRLIKADASYLVGSACLWITDAVIELYIQAPKSRKNDLNQVYEFPGTALLTTGESTVPCSICYMPLIVDYVAARAFMQDADSMDHRARASEHFKLFFDRAHLIEYGLPAKQTQVPISRERN